VDIAYDFQLPTFNNIWAFSKSVCPILFNGIGNSLLGGSLGLLSRNDGICYALTKKHANHIVQLTESGLTQGARVYNPCGIGITS
jgi:hypothetical protein